MNPSWKYQPLASLVDILDRQRVPISAKERTTRQGSVPYYGATGQVGTIDKAIFNEPLVLLGEDGVQFFDPFKSKAYLIDGPAWVNNHAHVLRTHSNMDLRFLTYYLNYFDYHGHANGTTRLKLTQAAMKTIPVPVPALDEQRRIVEFIEELFFQMDQGNRSVTLGKNKASALGSRIVTEHIGNTTCTEMKLAELIAEPIRNGRSVTTREDGFPVLRLTALRREVVNLSEHKNGAWDREAAQDYIVESGDFLVSRGNGSRKLVGRGSLVTTPPMEVAYPDTMFRIRPNRDVIHPQFLALVWNSLIVRRQIEKRARTTAGIYKVNQSDLHSVILPVPNMDDQNEIIDRVAATRRVLGHCLEMANEMSIKFQALQRSVLSAAFGGNLTRTSHSAFAASIISPPTTQTMILEAL